MERKSLQKNFQLIWKAENRIFAFNFYRFCQLIEKTEITRPALGTTSLPSNDPLRFKSVETLGFPASELMKVEWPDSDLSSYESLPFFPVVRTTFLGLYGVDSPMPTAFLDDIVQKKEGYKAVTDFLDIFHHRIITQYYRIWRKYFYPASFQAGGIDNTSQYLLGLIGLGITGTQQRIETPLSRFLALLSVMRLPTRNIEGLSALVSVLTKKTKAYVTPHSIQHISLARPAKLNRQNQIDLKTRHILGKTGRDANTQILLDLYTEDLKEAQAWLPRGELLIDFLIMLKVYLGWRHTVKIQLTIPQKVLPEARLNMSQIQLGRTAILGLNEQKLSCSTKFVTLKVGLYKGLTTFSKTRKAEEINYAF